MMVFVDGENLVYRYQDMLRQGKRPQPEVVHIKDEFVWSPQATGSIPGQIQIMRVTYYSYCTGDTQEISKIEELIKSTSYAGFNPLLLSSTLSPRIFRKERSQREGKGLDVQLTVDALDQAYQRNADIICLFSGDGSYIPLIQVCKRLGRLVYLAALSSGFNPRLKPEIDYLIPLDHIFFKSESET
jgi:uncharacterized LabA/DUF88 family protein